MKHELREKYGLPTNDADLAYEILTRCELGLPMQKLCVMLGLRSSDFKTCWEILGTVMGKYNVKITRWYTGGPTWVAIKRENNLISYYEAVRKGSPSPQERRPKTSDLVLQQLTRGKIYTPQDVAELTGYTPRCVKRWLDDWVGMGLVRIMQRGERGRSKKPWKFKVL